MERLWQRNAVHVTPARSVERMDEISEFRVHSSFGHIAAKHHRQQPDGCLGTTALLVSDGP